MRASILPVIHYADDAQAMRNAERATDAGCDGVVLIEMQGRNRDLPFAASSIAVRWPNLLVGLNLLGCSVATDFSFSAYRDIGATWTDEQLTHSTDAPWLEARRARKAMSVRPNHLLFCAVAFKYQRHEPDPGLAAAKAVEFGFIPTTSGNSTGSAPSQAAVEDLRQAIGPDAPLAIASGIKPQNAAAFMPLVSHIMVSTGVSASFYEFDPWMLADLVAVRDDLTSVSA